MVSILIISAELVTLALLRIKLFWNKGYDVMFSVLDVINKNL